MPITQEECLPVTKHHYPRTEIGALVVPVKTWNPQRSAPDLEFDYIDIASIDRESKTISQTTRVKAASVDRVGRGSLSTRTTC